MTEYQVRESGLRQRASGQDYNSVFERRRKKALYFALDRQSDDDVGALTGNISYVSRQDAERHLQILRRSLRRSHSALPLVLEAGCGNGGYLRWIAAQLPSDAVGFDASYAAIAIAGKRVCDRDRVLLFVADVRTIPLGRAVLGGGLALDVLHLIEDRQAALASLHKAMAPLASLVFTVMHPERESPHELAAWHRILAATGYALVAMRDLSVSWRQHMLDKHARRWQRGQYLRSKLGAWIEPELQVSAAMLGLHGGPSVARTTARYEFEAVCLPLKAEAEMQEPW